MFGDQCQHRGLKCCQRHPSDDVAVSVTTEQKQEQLKQRLKQRKQQEQLENNVERKRLHEQKMDGKRQQVSKQKEIKTYAQAAKKKSSHDGGQDMRAEIKVKFKGDALGDSDIAAAWCGYVDRESNARRGEDFFRSVYRKVFTAAKRGDVKKAELLTALHGEKKCMFGAVCKYQDVCQLYHPDSAEWDKPDDEPDTDGVRQQEVAAGVAVPRRYGKVVRVKSSQRTTDGRIGSLEAMIAKLVIDVGEMSKLVRAPPGHSLPT